MSEKLTVEEIKTLRKYNYHCSESMNFPSISPRLLNILLDNYIEYNNIKEER
jgi:hypothetical protein